MFELIFQEKMTSVYDLEKREKEEEDMNKNNERLLYTIEALKLCLNKKLTLQDESEKNTN